MPTWRGVLVVLLLLVVTMVLAVTRLHGFLAVDDGRSGGYLVVEGWASDPTLQDAVDRFRTNRYEGFYVTGGPIDWGAPLSDYKTYAERGAAVAKKMGAPEDSITPVAAPRVKQDRTYMSAVGLKRWLEVNKREVKTLHLVTEGTHARRSRLLFQKVFGPGVEVTVTSGEPTAYEPARWWASSAGVRAVVGEAIAYGYVRLFFSWITPSP